MKAKIVLLLILVTIGLMLASAAYSQDLVATVKIRRADIQVLQNDPRNELANMNCNNIITAYQQSDEDMNRILRGLDKSWYYGMNVFIGEDLWSIIDTIKKYDCYFLNPAIKKVVIGQSYQDGYYLVMIYAVN